MATIQDLLRAAEQRKKSAERAVSDHKNRLKAYFEALEAKGIENMTRDQVEISEDLANKHRAAIDDVKRVEGELAALRQVEAEEAETDRRMAETYTAIPADRMPGAGRETEYSAGDPFGVNGTRIGGNATALFGASPARDTGPQFKRASDGLPAALGRNERLADFDVARAEAAKYADRDRIIEGTHGSLGQLVRSISTTSGASAMVPTAWSVDVIDKARNASVVMEAGATLVPMNAKVVQIPRLTQDPAPVFKTEGSPVTATDPAFDNVTLTATSLSTIVVCSLELLQDAPNASEVVSNALAQAMALEVDKAALFGQLGATGGGGGDEGAAYGLPAPYPKGILKNLLDNASAQVLGFATNGTAQTAATPWLELLAAYYQVKSKNEYPVALVSNDKLVNQYMNMYDSTFQPLRKPMVLDGLPWLTTNTIPSFTRGTMASRATDVFIGDWSQVLIGQRMGLDIRVLTERYAENGQVGLLAYFRGDVQVARPNALAVYRALQGAL